MQTYNNYWKLNLLELPSMGKLYPQDTVIKIRPLNVQEIKYLATLNESNATDIINEILEKCTILKGIEFEDIFLGDRKYLAFWIRVNSFTRNSGYEVTINECFKCKNPFKHKINLTDFEEKYIKEGTHEIFLQDSGLHLKLKYPTIRDLSIKCSDEEIENFIRHIDIKNKDVDLLEKFIRNLSALDYAILKNAVEDMEIGFSDEITIYCPLCGHPHTYKIIYNDSGLLGTINLFEIMDMTLRISKTMNYQIQDTMPWMEVELLQEAANRISEEEQKELDKEKGKISFNKSTLNASNYKFK